LFYDNIRRIDLSSPELAMPVPAPSIALPGQPLTRLLALACLLLAIGLPFGTAWGLWALPAGDWLARLGLQHRGPVAAWQTGVASLVGLLPVAALCVGLLRARQCLLGFLRGETFGLATVKHLRGFAGALVASAVLGLVAPVLIGVVLTWNAPAGQHALSLSLASNDLLMALVAGIVWQVASVFTRAIELAEDHAQIV
jgi:hypothetical protein